MTNKKVKILDVETNTIYTLFAPTIDDYFLSSKDTPPITLCLTEEEAIKLHDLLLLYYSKKWKRDIPS